MSGSDDHTVCILDVRQTHRKSIYIGYFSPVINVASSPGSILVASADRTQIYDSQSGGSIDTIPAAGLMTNCRLSVDGDKILVAGKNLGFIRDLASKTQVRGLDYNGDGATFSPDGTCVASIYGKFLKIWKPQRGHKVYASTDLNNEAMDIRIAPDERLVAFISNNSAHCHILDATTSRSVLTFNNITSVAFSLTFVACLQRYHSPIGRDVEIWNTRYGRLNRTLTVDNDVLDIALSPDVSRLVSLSRHHVKLWDLETKECLAHLVLESELYWEAFSFASDGASVSVKRNDDSWRWHISPAPHINRTTPFIPNSDRTMGCHISSFRSDSRTKQRMVFVPIREKQSNRHAPRQTCCCDKDSEWILDQRSRRVLWIPPDERPQETKKHGRIVIIRTESGRKYIVSSPSL